MNFKIKNKIIISKLDMTQPIIYDLSKKLYPKIELLNNSEIFSISSLTLLVIFL